MALKSIIEIDVRDQSFKSFQDQWQRYQTQLAKAPGQWKAQTVEIKNAKSAFDKLVFDAIALNEQGRIEAKAQAVADKITTRQVGQWRYLVSSAREFSQHVTRASASLLRAVPLTAAVTGLLGAGSLFGLERLAASVSAGRRSSQGLGTTYGEQRAFNLNYERLVDAPQFLASVSEALRDVTKRQGLYGAGLTEGDLAGKNTTQVAAQLIPALKRIADRTPENQLAQVINSFRLGNLGVGVQDMVRLKATPAAEVAGIGAQYGQDVRALGLSGQTQRAWQDFMVQMDRAGERIEATFVRGLTPLIPGLTRLSESVSDATKTFLESFKNEDIETIGRGIKWLAEKFRWVIEYRTETPTGLVGDALKSAGAPAWTYDPEAARRGIAGLFGGSYVGDLGIKGGAGRIDPGMMALARRIRTNVPGVNEFTAFDDDLHHGFKSAHNQGRALDFTVRDAAQAESVAKAVRSELRAMGVEGDVMIEGYGSHPMSKHGTAPHVHVQTRSKIDVSVSAPSGSQVAVQANTVGQPP